MSVTVLIPEGIAAQAATPLGPIRMALQAPVAGPNRCTQLAPMTEPKLGCSPADST